MFRHQQWRNGVGRHPLLYQKLCYTQTLATLCDTAAMATQRHQQDWWSSLCRSPSSAMHHRKREQKKYIYAAIQPSILLQQQKKTRRKYLGRNHKTLFLGRKAKRSFFLRNRKGCALLFYNSRNKTSCAPYRPKRKKKNWTWCNIGLHYGKV